MADYARRRSLKIAGIFLLPALVVLFVTTIFPLLYSFNLSFRQFNLAKPFIPRIFVGLQNYKTLLQDNGFYHSLFVTFKVMVVAISVEFVLGFALALLLTQKLRGMGFIRTLFMIPMMMSSIVVSLIWLFLYFPGMGYLNYFLNFLHVADVPWITGENVALYSIALVDIWQWTPFVMLGIAAGLQSLPQEPLEAAMVDGNSRLQVLTHLTIPQLKPILASLFFLRAIDCFKIYDVIFVLTKGGPGDSTESLSFYIYREGFTLWQMGFGAAASFVALIIMTVLITLFIRTIKEEEPRAA
ncbi:MAG TPA: sugar ABC transporter permease [Roseiarcus sp.]|nr:sugar ABC transporter permease [Roseiarcus sp.]